MSDAGGAFVAHLGRDAAARCAPRTVFVGGSFAGRAGITRLPIGSIGRAATGFGRVLGLSQVQRWSMEDHTSQSLDDAAIRPPIDYWPFADDEEATGAASRREVAAPVVSTPRPAARRGRVDRAEALRRMLTGGAKSADPTNVPGTAAPSRPAARPEHRAPTGRAAAHRGLPITMRRQGRTWAGPGTAPGRTSTTSAPQNTGSVPAARVEPTRAQRSERSAGTDGAQEDRRPARSRRRTSRSTGHRASDAQTPAATEIASTSNPLASAARAIEPPALIAAVADRAIESVAPGQRADAVARGVQTAELPAVAPKGSKADTAAVVQRATPPTAATHVTTTATGADLEAGVVQRADARSSARSAGSIADDVALTRLASLPSSVNEPITRAESVTARQTEPLSSASNEQATPLVSAADLTVAPSAAAAADVALESARSAAEAAQRTGSPAVRAPTKTAATPAIDTRTTADVLRPIPLATIARRMAPDRARSASSPSTPLSSRSTAGDAAASSVGTSPQTLEALARSGAPELGASTYGQQRASLAARMASSSPMRIGDSRRVRVQRTTDGSGVVWNDPHYGARTEAPMGDDPVTALATVADAVPTVARSLDRALQDDPSFTPERPAGERYAGVVEAPLRARPPMAAAEAMRAVESAPSSSTPARYGTPAEVVRRASNTTEVSKATPSSTTSSTPGVQRSDVAVRHTDVRSPGSRAVVWVPATPGTLLGVNVLRRRPMQVDRAVGALPTLDRASSLDHSETSLGRHAPAATPESTGACSAAVRPDSSVVGRELGVLGIDPDVVSPVRRSSRASADDFRPVDLVSDAAVAPRAIPIVRRDLGGHAPGETCPASVASTHEERLQRSASIGRAERPVAGSPRTQATDLAERFLAELVRHRDERPDELPTVFRSIADVIVGDRRPLVSTSTASRRALAAVGKQAATTGDVIHLARPMSAGAPSGQLAAVMAHELTHVANPSPEPRFFDDDRDSAEERRAHQVGELMRTAPLAPRVIGASMTVQRTLDPGVASTSTSQGGSSSGGGTTSAAGLAARLTGDASPDTIRRSATSSPSPSPSSPSITSTSSSAPIVQRAQSFDLTESENSDFADLLRQHFDLIVDLLEERIIVDLERRGGRYRGDF